MLSMEEGIIAVRLAREIVKAHVKGTSLDGALHRVASEFPAGQQDFPPIFNEKRGVFVTLNTIKRGKKALRGCIGYPYPTTPLKDAITGSAVSACSKDPRFSPVQPEELDSIVVEVTVLTEPELISCPPREIPEHIEIGKHGLIVKYGMSQGLLLPQVAPEHGMDKMEFLSHTCMKAGLMPDAWLEEGCEVYRFEGQIFSEVEPEGEIIENSSNNMEYGDNMG
ncbi:MAG: TIGR00296 family protein [Methermicoccaceae archaeon]